jgi:hypothetical protein
MPQLWQKKKKPAVHHAKESAKKQNTYEKCVSEIGELFTKLPHEDIIHSRVLFFQTLRSFFADFLNIRYQFTYEELVSEIDRRNMTTQTKTAVKDFLVTIADMEYGPIEFDFNTLEGLLRQFGDLVLMLKKEFLEKPLEIAEETPRETFREKLKWVIGSGLVENFEKMKILMEKLETSIDYKELTKSRELYQEASGIFDRLPPEHKKILYPRLIELYEKILEMHE